MIFWDGAKGVFTIARNGLQVVFRDQEKLDKMNLLVRVKEWEASSVCPIALCQNEC